MVVNPDDGHLWEGHSEDEEESVVIQYEGPLFVRKKGGDLKRRHFVLAGDSLTYYMDEEEFLSGADPRGYIHLADVDRVEEVDDGFIVHIALEDQGRMLRLVAEEDDDVERWVSLLEEAMHNFALQAPRKITLVDWGADLQELAVRDLHRESLLQTAGNVRNPAPDVLLNNLVEALTEAPVSPHAKEVVLVGGQSERAAAPHQEATILACEAVAGAIELGLRLVGVPGRVFVEAVAPGRWGAMQGVQQGDELLYLGESLCRELEARDFLAALSKRPVRLTFIRRPAVSCSARSLASGRSAPGLVVAFKVENVSYTALSSDPALLQSFAGVVKHRVAMQAGHGLTEADIAIKLSAGSVVVKATINVPTGILVAAVHAAVNAATPLLSLVLVEDLAALPGMRLASSGQLRIVGLECKMEGKIEDANTRLYKMHSDKQKSLQKQKVLKMAEDERRIAKEVDELRMHSRGWYADFWEANPQEVADRLYAEHALHQQRLQEMRDQRDEQERPKQHLVARAKQRAASAPHLPRSEARGHAGQRFRTLHEEHLERQERRRAKKAAADVQRLFELDTVANHARARGVQQGCHELLYDTARERQERARMAREDAFSQASRAREKRDRSPRRRADLLRIKDLHEEHQDRRLRREAAAMLRQRRDKERLAQEVAISRPGPPLHLLHVASRFREPRPQPDPELSPRARRLAPATANATLSADGALGLLEVVQDVESERVVLAPVDHVLAALNAAVALRCGSSPGEARPDALHALLVPLGQAIEAFRVAATASEQRGPGYMALRGRPSARLFADGRLMDESEARLQCCAPDPIHQPEDDLTELLTNAVAAQVPLLGKVAPESEWGAGGTWQDTRWPAGAKFERTHFRGASFAFNPGVKARSAAETKAKVRFAPADPRHRYRHLLDLARCGIAFPDAASLQAGLEQILHEFEVAEIRNYYHQSKQSFLGERYVEVLVVLAPPAVPAAHVCELRLEEVSFFEARTKAEPLLQQIGDAFRNIYARPHADLDAIDYLARWVLQRPKEAHSVTLFRRALARSFGSAAVAWRNVLGGGHVVPFHRFRDACQALACRERTVEYWEDLDPTRAGCISLFELDPEAVILLAKFKSRIVERLIRDFSTNADVWTSAKALHTWLLSKASGASSEKRTMLEAVAFRNIAKYFGFTASDGDRMFSSLQSDSSTIARERSWSETLSVDDIEWLRKLPSLVDIDAATLTDREGSVVESVFIQTWAGIMATAAARRRTYTPAALLHLKDSLARSHAASVPAPPRSGRQQPPRKPFGAAARCPTASAAPAARRQPGGSRAGSPSTRRSRPPSATPPRRRPPSRQGEASRLVPSGRPPGGSTELAAAFAGAAWPPSRRESSSTALTDLSLRPSSMQTPEAPAPVSTPLRPMPKASPCGRAAPPRDSVSAVAAVEAAAAAVIKTRATITLQQMLEQPYVQRMPDQHREDAPPRPGLSSDEAPLTALEAVHRSSTDGVLSTRAEPIGTLPSGGQATTSTAPSSGGRLAAAVNLRIAVAASTTTMAKGIGKGTVPVPKARVSKPFLEDEVREALAQVSDEASTREESPSPTF